ncbi:hypothetical protein HDU92_000051 [Lobulomyces angularis]|nr:hypothetical protein HDU92_000051 [Lobulomyces angularis]
MKFTLIQIILSVLASGVLAKIEFESSFEMFMINSKNVNLQKRNDDMYNMMGEINTLNAEDSENCEEEDGNDDDIEFDYSELDCVEEEELDCEDFDGEIDEKEWECNTEVDDSELWDCDGEEFDVEELECEEVSLPNNYAAATAPSESPKVEEASAAPVEKLTNNLTGNSSKKSQLSAQKMSSETISIQLPKDYILAATPSDDASRNNAGSFIAFPPIFSHFQKPEHRGNDEEPPNVQGSSVPNYANIQTDSTGETHIITIKLQNRQNGKFASISSTPLVEKEEHLFNWVRFFYILETNFVFAYLISVWTSNGDLMAVYTILGLIVFLSVLISSVVVKKRTSDGPVRNRWICSLLFDICNFVILNVITALLFTERGGCMYYYQYGMAKEIF